MSSQNDPLAAAKQAERDLNSNAAKQGYSKGDSGMSLFLSHPFPVLWFFCRRKKQRKYLITVRFILILIFFSIATDSGIDDTATTKFPGASVTIGSAASGAGNNREIPVEEGGSIGKHGQPTKARDFEGEGGPEDKAERVRRERGGEDGV
ncbi:hypothetical protein BKA65DRAFT_396390 [Rhexocercosporidium sp. MPI-PUGE-AT-0058]|nr:hypothetical protein BKA65DRAFT_396390 [Rhexocercosporidium sp. MPI-PUGE-AT-0058]